jgi:putative transposase
VSFYTKVKHRESTIWQRRFWEHQIRDQEDFNRYLDYVHWNPVKHEHVACIADWPYTIFRLDVRAGIYPESWCSGDVPTFDPVDFGE